MDFFLLSLKFNNPENKTMATKQQKISSLEDSRFLLTEKLRLNCATNSRNFILNTKEEIKEIDRQLKKTRRGK